VFNTAILDFIEELQCLPHLQLYWDRAWGGMITLRLMSTYKQYTFMTQML
jgi:hypothetical protein